MQSFHFIIKKRTNQFMRHALDADFFDGGAFHFMVSPGGLLAVLVAVQRKLAF